MKRHRSNVNANFQCETFVDYEDEVEILNAIASWWLENQSKYSHSNMDCINISFDGDGCQADVIWTWLTPEMTKRLDEELKAERSIEVDEESISKN